jgi:hypothetical protein
MNLIKRFEQNYFQQSNNHFRIIIIRLPNDFIEETPLLDTSSSSGQVYEIKNWQYELRGLRSHVKPSLVEANESQKSFWKGHWKYEEKFDGGWKIAVLVNLL